MNPRSLLLLALAVPTMALADTHFDVANNTVKKVNLGLSHVTIACIDARQRDRPRADFTVYNDTTQSFSFLGISFSISCVGPSGPTEPSLSNLEQLRAIDGQGFSTSQLSVYTTLVSVDYDSRRVTTDEDVDGTRFENVFQCPNAGFTCNLVSHSRSGVVSPAVGKLVITQARAGKITIDDPVFGLQNLVRRSD